MKITGRPSKYKPEYCDQLIEHMTMGKSFETFAFTVKVGVATIYRWCEDNEDFREAKNIGVAASMYWWEERMRSNLITEEGVKFNTTGWIYTMKCRFKDYWTEKQEVAHVIEDKREIKNLSNEELRKRLIESDESIAN